MDGEETVLSAIQAHGSYNRGPEAQFSCYAQDDGIGELLRQSVCGIVDIIPWVVLSLVCAWWSILL